MQYTFQINLVGTVSADNTEDAKEKIKKEIDSIKAEELYEVTDLYYIDKEGYHHEWVIQKDEQ